MKLGLRRLRRRYGHASAGAKRYAASVEIALVPHFEKLGVAYWTARDVALDTVTKTHAKMVADCRKRGVHPIDCAAQIERDLHARRVARGEV